MAPSWLTYRYERTEAQRLPAIYWVTVHVTRRFEGSGRCVLDSRFLGQPRLTSGPEAPAALEIIGLGGLVGGY